jgi:hypothetical protein
MPRTPRAANGGRSRSLPAEVPAPTSAAARKAAIVEVVRKLGLHPYRAALSVGVPSTTFYRYVDDDEQFRDDLAEAEALFERRMVAAIEHDAISSKSWRAKLELLSRRFPDRWGERQKLDMTIEGFVRTGFESLSDDELDARLAELRDIQEPVS